MPETTIGALASTVPFEPTVAVAVVASVALLAAVAFLTFVAVAPAVSESWAERLHATPTGDPSHDADRAD